MRPAIVGRALLVLAGLAACRRAELPGGMSDSAFVATMAELRRVNEDRAVDSAARARRREAVLLRRRVTPEQLEQAAEVLANDPARASAVWQAIDRRVAEPDAPPEGAPPETIPD